MATALVAGRVSTEVKERADVYIARAGQTQASVIRSVWETIARTGRIPTIDDGPDDDLKGRMRDLRQRTPRSEFLETLSADDLKEELSHRG